MIVLKIIGIGLVIISAVAIGMIPCKLSDVKKLKQWRKNLSYGDKVKVNNGSTVFNAQIVGFPNGSVRVINGDMKLSAHSVESIYPI